MSNYLKLFHKDSLFKTREYSHELARDYKKADRFFIRLIFIHWILVSSISGLAYNTHWFGFISGAALFAISYFAYRNFQGESLYRNIVALVLLSFSIITIQQHLGRIEMHFHIFIVLSFLTRYKDLMPVTIGALFVIVHHLIFNYLQLYNVSFFDMPVMVFSYGCGLSIVFLHAFFVIFAWLVLVPIIHRQSVEFIELIDAQNYTNKINEKLEFMIDERTEKLRHSMLEAESANKMKSEFLANMSHEIRTPMNAIIGFTDLLEKNLTDPADKSYLTSIKSGSKSLLTIINDILDLSKIEAGKLTIEYHNVQLKNLLDEISSIFSFNAREKALAFEVEVAANIPAVMLLDEVRMRQILFNLLSNAIKFTHEGIIKMSLKSGAVHDDGTYDLIFEVKDSGIGIPEAQQEAMFEAFMQKNGQSSREYGGTGLGLSIVKHLVSLMNGEIEIDSKEGEGSTFRVILYNVQVGNDNPEERIQHIDYTFEPATIVIADDIAANRELLTEYLKNYPFTLIEAENGLEAVKCVNSNTDLVLMDIRMPVMDGYEACRIIQSKFNIPVLACTASIMESESVEDNKLFASFFQKPISIDEILNGLAKYLPHTEGKVARGTDKVNIDLPQSLISILNEQAMPLWQTANNDGDIDCFINFADTLCDIAIREKNIELQYFSQQLSESAKLFDIENIEKLMTEFKKMIERKPG